MAVKYWVVIRKHDPATNDYDTVAYEDGPFDTYDEALQRLGVLRYDDPNDATPAKYAIDERSA